MLQPLVEYARKNLADSEPGFTTRTVRWLVDISSDGQLINILPLGDDNGEQTPKCPNMDKMNAGGRAHFLVESLQTVSLHFKNNETDANIEKARKRHAYFIEMVKTAAVDAVELQPLSAFLQNHEQVDGLRKRCEEVRAKPSDWLRWSVAGRNPLRHESVLNWWRSWRDADQAKVKNNKQPNQQEKTTLKHENAEADGMICFLTGNMLKPLSTHRPIGGLAGGHPTGDVMVCFDKDAYSSFGLKKSCNAAMGEIPAQEYVDALNHLIRDKRHSYKLANTLVVHWFKESISQEDDPLAIFSEPPEMTEGNALRSAKEILASLRNGQRPVPPNNRYFALTMSGASKRVMVRDWMERSFEELVAKIEQWFSDLEIVAQSEVVLARYPKFNEVCLSMVRYDKSKTYFDNLNKLPAPTASVLWRVALAGLPIPQPFIAQALARFRADLIEDKPFNHARMGLIKAYFIRKGDHNMSAYLNKEHPEPAYQCGRLLAILAGLQHAALGDVGAGVVQRYYVAASQMPGLIIGRLMSNAKNHLGKVASDKPRLASWFEDQIAEIMSRIKDYIPTTLNLDQQSLFALGYYQQIASRKDKVNNDNNDTSGKGDN